MYKYVKRFLPSFFQVRRHAWDLGYFSLVDFCHRGYIDLRLGTDFLYFNAHWQGE